MAETCIVCLGDLRVALTKEEDSATNLAGIKPDPDIKLETEDVPIPPELVGDAQRYAHAPFCWRIPP